MKAILISTLLTISSALAIPSASLSGSSSQAPAPSALTRMKIALPDGVGLEDTPIVPMMDIQFPSFLKKPLERHDSNQKGYKHMEDTLFDPVVITPLSTQEQKQDDASIPATIRRYKQFLGVKDTGETRFMNIPTVEMEDQADEVNTALRAKTLIGVDNFGRRRFLDIPYYDRAADVN